MIVAWNYLACVFTVLVALGLPVAALCWGMAGKDGAAHAFLWGALCFTVFQFLTRIPLLQHVLPGTLWYSGLSMTVFPYTLFLGVSAALFEEGGRYLILRFCMKKQRRFKDALAFGVGHGGIEAILLVGVNALVVLLFYADMVSAGAMFLAGLERLFAMTLHIAWSILVFKSVRGGTPRGLLWAFLGHAAVDTGVGYLSTVGMSIYWIEGILGIMALFALLYILKERRMAKEAEVA